MQFLTETKRSEAETAFSNYYDLRQVCIRQKIHLLTGFPPKWTFSLLILQLVSLKSTVKNSVLEGTLLTDGFFA